MKTIQFTFFTASSPDLETMQQRAGAPALKDLMGEALYYQRQAESWRDSGMALVAFSSATDECKVLDQAKNDGHFVGVMSLSIDGADPMKGWFSEAAYADVLSEALYRYDQILDAREQGFDTVAVVDDPDNIDKITILTPPAPRR